MFQTFRNILSILKLAIIEHNSHGDSDNNWYHKLGFWLVWVNLFFLY